MREVLGRYRGRNRLGRGRVGTELLVVNPRAVYAPNIFRVVGGGGVR